jgi:Protein of unknown function (DUF3237)
MEGIGNSSYFNSSGGGTGPRTETIKRKRRKPGDDTQLKPLYTVRFSYPEAWEVLLKSPPGVSPVTEEKHFLFARGECEGQISGDFQGSNHPHRRIDRAFEMDLQGVIKTNDGATIMADYKGYGRVHKDSDPQGRRQVVGAAWHFADSERYSWLNDSVCAISGEVRAPLLPPDEIKQGDVKLVFDVAEIIWEKPTE